MAKYIIVFLTLFLACANAFAVLFTAQDNAFTMDLPAAWVKINTQDTVISLKRDSATLQIKNLQDCADITCLEAQINKELAAIKSKKFKVLENTYTGDIIKKTEFSTGDPIFSFSFSSAAVDFTIAAFLSDGKAFLVNIKGLPYVEADLVLSFISPAPKAVNPSASAILPNLREPAVADISLEEHLPLNMEESAPLCAPAMAVQSGIKAQSLDASKINAGLQLPSHIMLIFSLIFIFILLFVCSFVIRLVVPCDIKSVANPMSGYPIKGIRLYGSPDLFFKIHDNQGNNFIATSSRWGSIFMGTGTVIALLFFVIRTLVVLMQQQGFLNLHPVILNTVVSFAALVTVLGIISFAAGVLVDILFPHKFFLYDKTGTIVYKCVQKGFHFFKENYLVADVKSAIIFKLRRSRFTLKRSWTLSANNAEIATIKEKSFIMVILRLCLGHLCGFLRAQYIVQGRVQSSGGVSSYGRAFTYFKTDLDKPDAIEPEVMLITSAVIFMRDRDKFFPWVN